MSPNQWIFFNTKLTRRKKGMDAEIKRAKRDLEGAGVLTAAKGFFDDYPATPPRGSAAGW